MFLAKFKIEKTVISLFISVVILNPIFSNIGLPVYWPSLFLVVLLILFFHLDLIFKPINLVSIGFLIILSVYDINIIYSELNLPLGVFSFFIPFLITGLIQELIYKGGKFEMVNYAGKVSFYSLTILSVFTLIELIKNPLVIRSVFDSEQNHGVITYSFVGIYFLPFFVVIPILLKQNKVISLQNFLIVISFIVLLTAGLTTALFILVINLFLVIYLKYRDKSLIIKIMLSFLLVILMYSYNIIIENLIGFLPDGLRDLKKDELDNVQYDNFNLFVQTYRHGVYYESFISFVNNPFFGNSSLQFGQHSSVIDKLGLFGITGALIFCIIYFALFKNSFKLVSSQLAEDYLKLSSLVLFVAIILNPLDIYYMQFFYLFFLIFPCVISYFFDRNASVRP